MTLVEAIPQEQVETPAAHAATLAAEERTLLIKPSSGWSALDLREVWQFRDLLFSLGGRDLKLRYKQTALGVIWVVLQPLMAAGIFTVVFGKIAKLPSDGVSYFLFAFAGQLGWNLFANTVSKSSSCLVGNAHLISKVYFPRLILPLSSLPSTFVDFGVAAAMMVVLMFAYHSVPGLGLLLLPLWIAILLAMSIGIGLITSALTVNYRDVSYILPVFMQMLMYASPVAYGVTSVPESIKPFYFVNPVSPVLEGFRWSLLNTSQPTWPYVGYSAAVSLFLLVAGAFSFKRMERKFADVV
jgi:lipopolysaccharide transport system permease protein